MPRRLHPFIVPVRALKEQLKLLQTSFQFLPGLIQHNPFHLGQPHQVISLSKNSPCTECHDLARRRVARA